MVGASARSPSAATKIHPCRDGKSFKAFIEKGMAICKQLRTR
jgi:hypothetical protein